MPLPRILRLPHRPLAACAALVLPLALAGGGAFAATTAFSPAGPMPAAAHPHLTANTSACAGATPKRYMHCFAIVRTPADHRITADASGPPSTALTPADLQAAYQLPSATAGGGQTVAIVDAGGDPTAESDLATFRSQFGLPPCTTANGCFRQVNETGQASPLPPIAAGGWPVEESLDLDAVSSACPHCNILLVESSTAADADMEGAEKSAFHLGAMFISNSFGDSETQDEGSAWPYKPGVAVTASAGDSGYGVNFPSADPNVTAVGGTTLTKDSSVPRGWDESVWGSSSGGEGTGSGCSAYEAQPAFQLGIPALDAVCSNRATADVSADASPVSGLAVYDTTGEGGWLQVGGTSLASPLIAATYALAGPPQAGSYPNAYPYHDPNQSSDLFDVTQGANGNCGNVLCTAGPGWDGPTGLGTPDGVKAFQSGPQGTISGQVTDTSTGQPVAGATVTAQPGDYVTRTDSNGSYELSLEAGTYTSLSVSDYGYQTATDSSVTVTANQTTTENFALTGEPSGTLSGTVTDGSGHGWPLHAEITVPGDPNGPFWTSPYTGKYSITLPQGSYTLTVSTDYPGYQAKQVQVTVGSSPAEDVTLDADLTACTAPGYGWNGLAEDFAGWTGSTAHGGWAVTGSSAGWRFDNPGHRLAAVNPAPLTVMGDDNVAIADSGYYAPRPMDTTLTSPPVNLSGQAHPQLQFDSAYYAPTGGPARTSARVQLSTDGGQSWVSVWQQAASNAIGQTAIPVPAAANKPGVRVRFTYTGRGGWWWEVGHVFLGTHDCVPQTGGLLAGVITDHTSGNPANGAQVSGPASAVQPSWPEGTSLATADQAEPGGFYWLFSPVTGSQQFTATASGYATATATVNVAAGQVTRQDWALTPASGG